MVLKPLLGLLAFQVLGSLGQLLPALPLPVLEPLTPPGTYTSYQLGPLCKPTGDILSPTTEQQVQNIVLSAIASGKKVKAFGHRHSMTDIICTDGIAIDMSSFKGLQLNADNSVTAGAGVTLRELGTFLHGQNRALQVTPAYGGITIGGAIGTGAHGSSLKYESSLSGQTVGVRIINGTGGIQEFNNPEDLQAFRVHLGMIGIILEATIQTVPDFKMTVHNYEYSDVILTNGQWEPMTRAADSFFFYWFPSAGTVVISNGTFVNVTTPGDCWSNDHVPPTSDTFNSYGAPALEILQSTDSYAGLNIMERYLQKTLSAFVPDFVPIYTDDGVTLKNPGTGYPYKMMDAICDTNCPWLHYPNNFTFLDNELSLDIKDMAAFITTVKDILSKSPGTFPLQGILMRFSKATNTFMSTAYGRDTVHFEWYPLKRKNQYENPISGTAAYQTMMQALAITYGGRSHWGKTGNYYHTRDMIQRKLTTASWTGFLAQMRKIDPNQLFMNNFGRRLLNISETIDIDPKTTHCAILDNCVCKVDSDCATGQICGTISGYDFLVCKNPGLINISLDLSVPLPFTSIVDYFRSVLGLPPLLSSVASIVKPQSNLPRQVISKVFTAPNLSFL